MSVLFQILFMYFVCLSVYVCVIIMFTGGKYTPYFKIGHSFVLTWYAQQAAACASSDSSSSLLIGSLINVESIVFDV